MKKFLKWTGFVVAGLVGIALISAVYVYFASESEFARRYEAAAPAMPNIPTDPVAIEEGGRLARMRGCQACHGEQLTGAVPVDIPNVARFTAPNLTGKFSEAELVTAIRTGVKRDGTSTWLMPSVMFAHMTDEDLGRIVAYVRSRTANTGMEGGAEMRPIGRAIVAKGDFLPSAREVAELEETAMEFDSADPLSHGRYLVMNLCSECHGQDLKGRPVAHNAPNLAVVKAYSTEAFASFMKDGKALGGRELELMSQTARDRFSIMTPEEVSAMYAFLQARSDAG
ncbi:MAG TPA: c-type cytochrome [Steroidobacteraceae bacterium]|nr:c-type cytochrome [Steroidobacteraceae bacterium]